MPLKNVKAMLAPALAVTLLAVAAARTPMIAPHGAAYVTTLPTGAQVWMDGAYAGQTPLLIDGLAPGRHLLTAVKTGWRPQSAVAVIELGSPAPVSLILQRMSGRPGGVRDRSAAGSLTVRGAAAGESVYVDGVKIGVLPVASHREPAGMHILSVVDRGNRSIREIQVYPDVPTAVWLAPASGGASSSAPEDVLAPLASYVPASGFVIAGDELTIHYRGYEAECTLGSRAYVLNGRPGTFAVAPTRIGRKIYMPLSLLRRFGQPK